MFEFSRCQRVTNFKLIKKFRIPIKIRLTALSTKKDWKLYV